MDEVTRTPAGAALTDLITDLFRVNSRILAEGDVLVSGLGLTSARWQILGAIIKSERSQPVAWLARDLGANRQNVQRIVNDLHKEGLLSFETNPHHRRAQLVVVTNKGRQAYGGAMLLEIPWVNQLSEGIRVDDLRTTHEVLKALRQKLSGAPEEE